MGSVKGGDAYEADGRHQDAWSSCTVESSVGSRDVALGRGGAAGVGVGVGEGAGHPKSSREGYGR